MPKTLKTNTPLRSHYWLIASNLLVLSANAQLGAQTLFTAAAGSPFAAGTQPSATATGDFNRDGKLDLVVANATSNTVTILTGYGAGGFSAQGSSFPTGTNPAFVAVADFNGDGKLDIAVANAISNNVTVLLGNGAGGFTAAPGSPFAVGKSPVSVALGDFNRDGKLDMVTANRLDKTVTVLLGNGTGGFTPARSSPFAAGAVPVSVTVGDFNGDGQLDIATVSQGDNYLKILQGAGNGNFDSIVQPQRLPAPPAFVTAAELTGDGIVDLIVASASANTVVVLKGNGRAAFLPVSYPVGTQPVAVAAGDFNGDGLLDLATANQGSNNLTVLLANGSGGFTAAAGSPFPAGTTPAFVVAGDFNGDGKTDLAATNSAGGNVTVLLNGTLARPFEPIISGNAFSTGLNPGAEALGDFNGDGKPDLAIANTSGNSVTVLLGKGAGSFTPALGSPFSVASAGGPVSVVAGDFNGDGKLDLATANNVSASRTVNVVILLGNGAGGFTAGSPINVTNGVAVAMVAGDFNVDGKLDLAIASNVTANSHTVTILSGDGAGGFTAGTPIGQLGYSLSLVAGDLNRDGKLDLIASLKGSIPVTAVIGLGDGAGDFGGKNTYAGSLPAPYSMVSGDFNKDGLPDLAIVDSTSNNVTVLLGNGTGGLSPATGSPYPVGKGAASVAAVDFNQDGNLDLVTADHDNGTATVLLGNGLGNFSAAPHSPFTVGSSPRWVVVGDFNGDSRPDLAFTNDTTNKVSILLNSTQLLQSITVSPSPASVAAGSSLQFTATGHFSDGTSRSLPGVIWSSSSPAVATISSAGLAQGVTAGGPVKIAASLNGVSATSSLTVTVPVLVSISVSTTTSSIAAGLTTQFRAAGQYADGASKDLTASVTWSSSAVSVATIGSGGVAKGIAVGAATIKATLNGISGTAPLTVTPALLTGLSVTPNGTTIRVGQTLQFTATGSYSDGSTKNLTTSATWGTFDTRVATVSTTGLVTGKGPLSTLIYAIVGTFDTGATVYVQ